MKITYTDNNIDLPSKWKELFSKQKKLEPENGLRLKIILSKYFRQSTNSKEILPKFSLNSALCYSETQRPQEKRMDL